MFRIGDSFEDYFGHHPYQAKEEDRNYWRMLCQHWHTRNRDKFEPLLLTSEGNYVRKIQQHIPRFER